MGFVVAAVKVAAAFVAKNVVAKAVVKLAATALISKVATRSISKLIAKRSNIESPGGGEGGGRIQLPPATDNKLPIVFGSAWVNGVITDAKISVDNKYMWYVLAFSDVTTNSVMSFDTTNGVYYDGKKVTFGTNGAVASLSTNTTPAQVDTKVANKIYIWLFPNGYNSGINTGGLTAIDILSDSVTGGGIPDALRWNGGSSPSTSIYTANGQNPTMDYVAFAIVRVEYNADAGTTNLGSLQVKLTNNLGATNGAKPGDAILEYMTDPWSGANIDIDNIDTASLTTLNTYSDQSIQYIDTNGNPQTQSYRYRVNGVLDTSNTVMNNLQMLVDACDSWLQYNEATGKWRVVPNAPYTGTLASLYNVNDDVVLGGIQINPIDLNYTYNQVEVAYPNTNVKDQSDYQIVDLTDPTTSWYSTFNTVLSPNEALNRLQLTLPMVNSAVQAKYIAVRRLLQSREDLVINFVLDYSGIQIDAGDVIRVNHNAYGWTDKLFRVSNVSEVQDEQGNLMASIEAFEYNGSIYTSVDVSDYIPADNTGLTDPNIISAPCDPVVNSYTDSEALITGFLVTTCVPEEGTVLYMDFNYGTTSNIQQHVLYKTVTTSDGTPFVNSDFGANIITPVYCEVNDLIADTYFWSATARNNTAGRTSGNSAAYTWGGANIQPWDGNSNSGGISGNQVKSNTIVLRNFASDLNVTQIIGGGSFSIREGQQGVGSDGNPPATTYSTPLLPVWANGNSTRNVPIKIYGPNIDANNYWPYANGTSLFATGTTGNCFYLANSTAAFTPNDSALLLIQDGDDNWWRFTNRLMAPNTVAANQQFQISTSLTVSSDTPDTIIQLIVGYTRNDYGNTGNAAYLCQTEALNTITLKNSGAPEIETYVLSLTSNSGPNFTGGAGFIRVLTPNATVTISEGGCTLRKGPFEFL